MHCSFIPSHKASTQITKCMKQKFNEDRFTWAAVIGAPKEFYLNEFKVILFMTLR